MNKTLTSKDEILRIGREMVAQSGIHSLNMRDVAKASGICVGTIYNYFPSKDDLIIAVIASVWKEIMQDIREVEGMNCFVEYVSDLFCCIQSGGQKYPTFFSAHAMNISEGSVEMGRSAMKDYFSHIKHGMELMLEKDMQVRKDAFSHRFSKSDFIDFVFLNIISLLVKRELSCEILLEIIRRTIYEG